jgi:hypothetical protein
MHKALLDLAMLASVIGVVFTVGSAVLLLNKGANAAFRAHPITWLRSTYTLKRWLTDPFQVCIIAMLWQANFQQLALTGPSSSLAGDLDYRSRLYLTLANLVGACVCFYGLHLRDFERSLRLELGSFLALAWTLGIWVTMVYYTVTLPNTSYGLNLAEGTLIACVIRGVLIQRYKSSLKHGADPRKIARLRLILGGDIG